ncbi:MAG: DUF47 domain-containing protein [Hyphomicrobiaceae bacterium]
MTTKKAIVAALGDSELLRGDRIGAALIGNDQVKYYFALLQTARTNADRPQMPPPTLRAERQACQLADLWLDDVVESARKQGGGLYRLPRAAEILARARAAIETMLACLPDADRQPLATRLGALPLPAIDGDALYGRDIDIMTSGDRKAGDSLHLLVMDAHRAINRLQAATAEETIDGAHASGLSSAGRRAVQAFMEGLNRTAPLKFDHPGLGTTATEHAGQILIQNDIGTTDAHVLVIGVDGRMTTITYTDIHPQRLQFFRSLFARHDVAWQTAREQDDATLANAHYILLTGTHVAEDDHALGAFLSFLGSRIVFLIDWNRMRKRLRLFVGKSRTLEILRWAADNDFGHRGLLEVGGERALADAVEYAAGPQLRYGQRLDDLLNEERATEFLKHALAIASRGLLERRSRRSILDEIRTRLRGYFEHERLAIFDTAAAHVAVAYDLALGLREALERVGHASGGEWIGRFAARAVRLESRADALLNEAREDMKRFKRPLSLQRFFDSADDACDELEEAAALIDLLLIVGPGAESVDRLKKLADLMLQSTQDLVTCVECAASVTRADVREDLDEFLVALERLIAIEHQADDELRRLTRWLIQEADDHRRVMLIREISQVIEAATDATARAGQMLRTYLLEEVIA